MKKIPLNERLETKQFQGGNVEKRDLFQSTILLLSPERKVPKYVLYIYLVRCGHSSLLHMVSSPITLAILVDILPGTVISLAAQMNPVLRSVT